MILQVCLLVLWSSQLQGVVQPRHKKGLLFFAVGLCWVVFLKEPKSTNQGNRALGDLLLMDKILHDPKDPFLIMGNAGFCPSAVVQGYKASVSPRFDKTFGFGVLWVDRTAQRYHAWTTGAAILGPAKLPSLICKVHKSLKTIPKA